MENFNSFESPTSPKKELGSVISHAFDNYAGIIVYSIIFVIIYFFASILISGLLSIFVPGGQEYQHDVMNALKDFSEGKKFDLGAFEELQKGIEEARNTTVIIADVLSKSISSAIFAPLIASLLYVVHKFNSKQNIEFSDLFIGYKQNTVQIIIYGFIASAIIYTGLEIHKIIGLYLSFAFFLGLPIVFFENSSAIDAIRKSFTIVHSNFLTFILTFLLSLIIGGIGVLLCGIGIIFTLPFFYTVRYSLYCAFCGTPYEVKNS